MTIKQQRLINEVVKPENIGKPLMEIGIKAGYSKRAGNLYNKAIKSLIVKKLDEQGISRESLTEVYKGIIDKSLEKEDFSTAKGATDSLAKMHNHMKDVTTQQVTAVITSIEDKFKHRLEPSTDQESKGEQCKAL